MPWLPRFRPRVSLKASSVALLAGDVVELVARVDAPRPRRVERFDLWMEQIMRSSRGRASRFRLHALLSGPTTLAEGPTLFRTEARLPADALPDHSGRRIGVDTLVRMHLRSRWWPDVQRSFRLVVLGAPSTDPVEPLLFSSRARGSSGPFLEGSLDRSVLRPGGMLTGRVSAMGCDAQGFSVTLCCEEHDGVARWPGARWSLVVDQPLTEGASAPFALTIPPGISPGYQAGGVRLSWAVELRAVRTFARDLSLRIPVQVAVPPRGAPPEANAAAPAVGDARVTTVWRLAAERTGMVMSDDALRAELDPVTIEVRPEDGGLLATLRFPPLGIGLEGGERRGLRRLTREGEIPALGEWWNQHCRASSREPAQAGALLEVLLGQLVAVRFREASDDRIALWVEAPRDDGAALERLAGLALRVAERFEAARAAMPMPGRLEPHRGAWEAAARELEAELAPGPPSLAGPGGTWRIETRWTDDEPRTAFAALATTPIDERLTFDSAAAEPPDALSRDARPLAEALAGEGRLVVRPTGVELTTAGALEDPLAARGPLERLGRLVRLLRVDEGPYR